jgi:hypothetical protein
MAVSLSVPPRLTSDSEHSEQGFDFEMRMMAHIFTTLKLSDSNKRSNPQAVMALAIAYHNLCRYHGAPNQTAALDPGDPENGQHS